MVLACHGRMQYVSVVQDSLCVLGWQQLLVPAGDFPWGEASLQQHR